MIDRSTLHVLFFLILIGQFSCTSLPAQAPANTEDTEFKRLQDHTLKMPRLERDRTIRVYLPPGYEKSNKKYPVLYLHDGQNLFEDSTSFAGEWGVDESLDSLSRTTGLQVIAVGIDNGGSMRIHELNPMDHPEYGHAEGEAYLEFIRDEVKPLIDRQYRTLTEREHTALLGSSLGGLISHFALITHPDTYSKVGLFSPSYWFSPGMYELAAQQQLPENTRVYMLAGGAEENMVEPAERMRDLLLKQGQPPTDLEYLMDPKGKHHEAFWRTYFPVAIQWLFQ